MRPPSTSQRFRRAFSLVEMLVVMALAVTLIALASFGISGVLMSTQLTQGGQLVMDSISLARQEAVRSNREVQIVFFKLPGEGGAEATWKGMQLWSVEETVDGRVVKEMGNLITLPKAIVISPDAVYSPLLTADATVSGTRDVGEFEDVEYKGIRVRPGGNLDSSVTPSNNFLTLKRFTDNATPPVNYFTIQINPVTSAVQSYRP